MIVYRCDRCKKDIDLGVSAFDEEEYLSLDVEPHNCRGFNSLKHYLLCEKCKKSFENFMDGLE